MKAEICVEPLPQAIVITGLMILFLMSVSNAGVLFKENAFANLTVYPEPVPYDGGLSDWQYFEICSKDHTGLLHGAFIFPLPLVTKEAEINSDYQGWEYQPVTMDEFNSQIYQIDSFTLLLQKPPACTYGSDNPLNSRYYNFTITGNATPSYACINATENLGGGFYNISWYETIITSVPRLVNKTGWHDIKSQFTAKNVTGNIGGVDYVNAWAYYTSAIFTPYECKLFRIKYKADPAQPVPKWDLALWSGAEVNCYQDDTCAFEVNLDPTFDNAAWDYHRNYTFTIPNSQYNQETLLVNFDLNKINSSCFVPGYDRWVYVDPNNATNRTSLNFHYFFANTTNWSVAINMTRPDTPVINGVMLQHYYCNNSAVTNNSDGNSTYFAYYDWPPGTVALGAWTVTIGNVTINPVGGLIIGPTAGGTTTIATTASRFGQNTTFISSHRSPTANSECYGYHTSQTCAAGDRTFYYLTGGSLTADAQANGNSYSAIFVNPITINKTDITYMIHRNETSVLWGHNTNFTDRGTNSVSAALHYLLISQDGAINPGSQGYVRFVAVANTSAGNVTWVVADEEPSASVTTMIVSPYTGEPFNTSSVPFNVNVTGTFNSYTCNWTRSDYGTNLTNWTMLNNINYTTTWTLPLGYYNLSVTCSNGTVSNHANVSNFWLNWSTEIAVVHKSPQNITYNSTANMLYNVTANGSFKSYTCNYALNGVNSSNFTIVNNTFYNTTLYNMAFRAYTLNTTCSNATNSSSETIKFLLLDVPVLKFNQPLAITYLTTTVPYSFNITNSSMATAHCWQDVDGSIFDLGNITMDAGYNDSITLLTISNHHANVTCMNGQNVNISYNVSFTVDLYKFNTTNFLTQLFETNTTPYNLSINVNPFVTSLNATLEINGTNYTVTSQYNISDRYFLSYNATTPLLILNNSEMNHTWYVTFILSNGTNTTTNITNASQVIYYAYYFNTVTLNKSTVVAGEALRLNATFNSFFTVATFNATGKVFSTPVLGFEMINLLPALSWSGTFYAPNTNGTINASAVINISYGGVSRIMTMNASFTVLVPVVTDCAVGSASTVPFINYTHYDEENDYPIYGTNELTIMLYNQQYGSIINYSFNNTNVQNFTICFAPTNATFIIDSYHKYTAYVNYTFNTSNVTYPERHHYFRGAIVSNVTTNITLYSLSKGNASLVEAIVSDQSTRMASENTLIIFSRKDYAKNYTSVVVDMCITGQEGACLMFLRALREAEYTISYIRSDKSAGRLDTIETILSCASGFCTKNIILPTTTSTDFITTSPFLRGQCTVVNTTDLSCWGLDITNTPRNWELHVYNETAPQGARTGFFSITPMCNQTSTASTTTLNCVFSPALNNYKYELGIVINDVFYPITGGIYGETNDFNYGLAGVFGALLLFMVVAMMRLNSPSLTVAFGLIAFIAVSLTGLFRPIDPSNTFTTVITVLGLVGLIFIFRNKV